MDMSQLCGTVANEEIRYQTIMEKHVPFFHERSSTNIVAKMKSDHTGGFCLCQWQGSDRRLRPCQIPKTSVGSATSQS